MSLISSHSISNWEVEKTFKFGSRLLRKQYLKEKEEEISYQKVKKVHNNKTKKNHHLKVMKKISNHSSESFLF